MTKAITPDPSPSTYKCLFCDEVLRGKPAALFHFGVCEKVPGRGEPGPSNEVAAERAWKLFTEHPEWKIDYVGGEYYVTSIAIDESNELHAHAADPITAILAAGKKGIEHGNTT